MAKQERPRYTPPRLGQRDFARTTMMPRWFTREAVEAFGLNPYDHTTFVIIADNLDAAGVSQTATTLIASRGGMSRGAAARAIDRLIANQLLFELDPRKNGHMMRYAIPAELPWTGERR